MIDACTAAFLFQSIIGRPEPAAWLQTAPTAEHAATILFDTPEGQTLYPYDTTRWVPHIANTAAEQCGPATVNEIVDAAADEYGVSRSFLHRVIHCESGHNPDARNPQRTRYGHALGLGQHLEQLWPARAEAIGQPGASPYDPVANARATAWLIANQGTRPYLASKHCWSR